MMNTVELSSKPSVISKKNVQSNTHIDVGATSIVRRGKGYMHKGKGAPIPAEKAKNAYFLSKKSFNNVSKRGGCHIINGKIQPLAEESVSNFIERIIRYALIITIPYAGRKTVTVNDVTYSLKKDGRQVLGWAA